MYLKTSSLNVEQVMIKNGFQLSYFQDSSFDKISSFLRVSSTLRQGNMPWWNLVYPLHQPWLWHESELVLFSRQITEARRLNRA